MATSIQRVEKEYILGMLNKKGIPLKCFAGKHEYTFMLQKLDKDRMVLESKEHLSAFRENMKIELKFSAQSTLVKIITFSAYVYEAAGWRLITSVPDHLYKNLSRSYSRVQQIPGLNIIIQKDGFYYDFDYKKIGAVAPAAVSTDDFVSLLNGGNVKAAMNEHLNWIKKKTEGYKLVLFKKQTLSSIPSIEGKAVGTLGKVLFISMPAGGFVSGAENAGDMFFTESSFMEYLLNNGESPESAREKIAGLLRQRAERNVCGDCYIPVVFLSYIVGYIHIWVNEGVNPPLTLPSIDKLCQFAKLVALSLERDNYFEYGKKKIPPFSPKPLNISAGGFLFALDLNEGKTTYSVNDHLSVQITFSGRVIRCNASIIREHFDKPRVYYGCKFEDMKIEDTRFLFEAIYGLPFTDNDIPFIAETV
jgi:hypothetical protein